MATSKKKASRKKPTTSSKKSARKAASKKAAASWTRSTAGPEVTKYSEWFRSTNQPRQGIVMLDRGVPEGTIKAVEYSAIDGWAIFEGDILLGTVEEMEKRVEALKVNPDVLPTAGMPMPGATTRGLIRPNLKVLGVVFKNYRWPNAFVPYEIDPNLPNQQRITDAMSHWESKTRIRFLKRTPQNSSQSQMKNYVRFEDQGGCFSEVGRKGGKQIISIAPGCGTGSTIHEIGHAVGLWHEQSREDRTKFVTINFQNIESGKEHNFNQHISDGDDVGVYDYRSIMHYGPTAFSKNGKPTIVPKQSGASIGQRSGLSAGDIAAVAFMYEA